MKRMLVLLLLLCVLPLATLAEEPAQAAGGDDDARIYVIQKGDTLWGISQRFIKDPEYWPNLWANNPFVTNPHLIYPGQKIKFHDGRIEIVPAQEGQAVDEVIEGTAEETVEETVAPAEPPEPVEQQVVRVAGGEGYVSADELDAVGLLADTVDNRYMMVEGDTVFVTFKELDAVRPGDRFDVVRSIGRVVHPVTGRYLGEKISELGVIEVRDVHAEVATAEIVESEFEMQRGDRLLMPRDPRQVIRLKKAPAGIVGVVAEARQSKLALAENDYIYLDLGSSDGLSNGNVVYISRERRATELAEVRNLKLPERLLGAAVVVDTRPTTATALVLKSVDAIRRGDKIFTQAD